jgi:predicted permease
MSGLRWLWRSWFSRARFESELDEELAFHVAARRDDLERSGLDRAAAERQARIELGMRETYKDECRQARGLTLLESLAIDLRQGARSLRRDRGFTLTALAVLGIALAANLLLFVFVRAYLYGGGVSAPRGAWVDIVAEDEQGRTRVLFTEEEAERVRAAARGTLALSYVEIEQRAAAGTTGRVAYGRWVSADYWRAVGVTPLAGRLLTAEEDRANIGPPAVLLTRAGWRRLFASDPQAVGKTLVLGGRAHVVAGIVPDEAKGFDPVIPQYFVGIGALPAGTVDEPRLFEIGGTLPRPGKEAERAVTAALQTVVPGLRELAAGQRSRVRELRAMRRRGLLAASDASQLSGAVLVIAVAFGLVLLVACANLANLSLSRAVARQREIAVRLSLGAGRARVVRQLLTESVLVATLAAGLGVGLAVLAVRALQNFVFRIVSDAGLDVSPIAADGWIVVAALALAVVAALAFGLAPALQSTMRELSLAAKRDAGAFGGRLRGEMLRRLLIVGQVAVSLVLLVVASLLVANGRHAATLPLGFDPERVLDAGMTPASPEWMRRLETIPGVAEVSAVSQLPLAGDLPRIAVRVGQTEATSRVRVVDERFFAALDLPLLAGRGFARAETTRGARVAVLGEASARRLFPEGAAIGRTFEVPARGEEDVPGSAAGDLRGGRYRARRGDRMVLRGARREHAVRSRGARRRRGRSGRRAGRAGRASSPRRPPARGVPRSGPCRGLRACAAQPLARAPARPVRDRRRDRRSARPGRGADERHRPLRRGGLPGQPAPARVRRARRARLVAGAHRPPGDGLGRPVGRSRILVGTPLCLALSLFLRAVVPALRSFDLASYAVVPAALAVLVVAASAVPAFRAARVDPSVVLRED